MAKEKGKRKKLSAKTFTAIVAPLLAILLAFSIALPVITTSRFDLVLRDIFGEAESSNKGSDATDAVDATYYTRDITDSKQLQADEQAYTRRAGAEGFVLLYNRAEDGRGLPVAAGSKLSLFSSSSVDLLAGGTGSGVSTISSDMKTALTEQGFSVNEALWKFYSDNHATYTRGGGAIMYGGSEDWSINEAPISAIPDAAKSEAAGTTPVFFLARTGGEGRDLGRHMGNWTNVAEDKDKHYLEPDSVELGVIQYLNDNFDNVIIVVNTNNAFELGWEVEVSDTIKKNIDAIGAGSASLNPMTDDEAGKLAGEFGKTGGPQLIDFRGRDFDEVDAEGGWDALIDQMTTEEIKKMIRNAGYQTLGSTAINKPRAVDFDGPSGLNEGGVTHEPYSITYPCAANLAASWDRKNSYLHGYYVGEDGLAADGNWGSHTYTGIISGWYAPAMNIHRTPFAGRNFEYYSEDGFMSGELALEASRACAEKGVYAYIKHFALNDQEDHRSHAATFSNEQAIREIYLKPFQTCIEERGTTKIKVQNFDEATGTFTQGEAEIPAVMAVMTSFNRIGCTWAGGNYNLITGVLRNEWGFDGSVLTDYDNGGVMDTEQCIRAGGDLKLTAYGSNAQLDMENPASRYHARQAMKHVLYTTVNSNAMNGIVHGVAVSELPFANYYYILIGEAVVAAALIAWGTFAIVRRWKKEKAGA